MTDRGVVWRAGRSGDLTWGFTRRRPDRRLAGLVLDVCGYTEHSPAPVRRRQTPVASVPVILTFGPPITVAGVRHGSFVAGPHDVPVPTEFVGAQRGIELRLSPLGAYRLLGVPLSEYTNRVVDLPLLDALADRAANAPGWAVGFDLVSDLLIRRAAEGPEPDPAIDWAWRVLSRHHGGVSVRALATEIGWSHRHFAARFRAQTGLAPKVAARVLRFERAADLLAGGVPAAAVAARCGYTDQSHLVREFRALGGCTPGTYLAERDAEQVTFVQDGASALV